MTLVNLVLTGERVMLVTDTLTGSTERPRAFHTKFSHLAHCSAVLAARGADEFHHEAAIYLQHQYLHLGIETAVLLLPEFLAGLEERVVAKYPGVEDLKGEIVIAGWSPIKERFAGWRLGYDQGYAAVELEVGFTHYAPAGPDYRPMPYIDFGERLIAIAKAQHRVMVEETPPGMCPTVGGDLVAIDLTRAGATVRKVARLDGYDELVAWITGERAAA